MQDELEDKNEDYCPIPHEEWFNLISTMEVKDNSKRAVAQIKRLVTSKSVPVNYGSDDPIRFPRNKKVRTDVIPSRKQHGGNIPKHHDAQCYCVMCKKAVIPEKKWRSHIYENLFGKIHRQQYIKDILVGPLYNIANAFNRYQKSEK